MFASVRKGGGGCYEPCGASCCISSLSLEVARCVGGATSEWRALQAKMFSLRGCVWLLSGKSAVSQSLRGSRKGQLFGTSRRVQCDPCDPCIELGWRGVRVRFAESSPAPILIRTRVIAAHISSSQDSSPPTFTIVFIQQRTSADCSSDREHESFEAGSWQCHRLLVLSACNTVYRGRTPDASNLKRAIFTIHGMRKMLPHAPDMNGRERCNVSANQQLIPADATIHTTMSNSLQPSFSTGSSG